MRYPPRNLLLSVLLVGSLTHASPFRGTVHAPEVGLVFLARLGGGLEALRIDDGELAWTVTDVHEPLTIAGGLLFALGDSDVTAAPRLNVSVIDPRTGRITCALRPEVAELPHPFVQDTRTGQLRVSVMRLGGGLYLNWSSESGRRNELLEVSASEPSEPPRHAYGIFEIDLATCRASPVTMDQLPPPTMPEPEPGWHGLKLDEPGTSPFHLGKEIVALEVRPRHTGFAYRLKRWNRKTRRVLRVQPLVFLKHRGALTAAVDRRHLAVSEWVAGPRAGNRWHVFSSETGRKVAVVEDPCFGGHFAVAGERIVTFDRERICVLDAKTGRQRAERPVRPLDHPVPIWK